MLKTIVTTTAIIIGTASFASAMCGPQISLSANQSANDVLGTTNNDSVGVAEYGDTFNFGSGGNSNKTRGLTLGLNISFNLDGGRGCREQDLRIIQSKDAIARAAHQAELQERQQSQALIANVIAGIAYCESADLSIPANTEFCVPYTAKD